MPQNPRKRILETTIAVLLLAAAGIWWLQINPQAEPEPSGTNTTTHNERLKSTASTPSGSAKKPTATSTTIPTDTDPAVEPATLTQKLEEILNEPDSLERPGLLLDLMTGASMAEVQALLAASDAEFGDSPAFQDQMKAAAYERWYHLDPAAALRAMDRSTMAPERKSHLMEVFLDDWTGREPEQVAAFLQEGELKGIPTDRAYSAVVRGASLAGDVAFVNSALSRITDPKLHSYAVRAAARHLQRDHDSLFEDWLAALPASQQGAALAESAWILSKIDIDQALENLERLEQVEAERVPVTRARVVVKWAEEDPRKAADWVASQPLQGEEREALFANLLNVWVSKDRDVAMTWIEALIEKGEIDEAFMNRVATRM